MASSEIDRNSSTLGTWMPRAVAIVGGLGFIAVGVWAMVGWPRDGCLAHGHARNDSAKR